ncbi:helix-turn-helix transcriptional regulator [Thiothrix winogradskyi]|uniref:AlpA family phage regulatory protein n=1 Tax=Thiothrix winogradskyi TaxID=96472 RepID=A0ABY3T5R0_9GAMM|nr:AlpA family phage regulatory protein [Thiothrix winogradskyi]UJS26049.1 AlpA family phage regulatory protein [Thiothrix winogradskyi]
MSLQKPRKPKAPTTMVSAPAGDRLCRLTEVMAIVGLKKSTIYKAIRDGRFPKQAETHTAISQWRYSDLQAYVKGDYKPIHATVLTLVNKASGVNHG